MGSYVQANTNGRLHPASEPSLSPLNRGFLYGDAVYEVWRTYGGVLFAWEEHWERLERSAAAVHLPLPCTRASVLEEIRRTVAAFRQQTGSTAEVYVRLQIFRGEGTIGLDTALAETPGFILLVQENKLYSEAVFAAGLRLSIARDLRRNLREALNPAWKTGNYLNNILCLREARARGADEVLICNQQGEITEAAVSNVAFVKGGVVLTPPHDAGILAGVTRRLLLEKVAPGAGIRAVEQVVRPEDLPGMEECFLLSTTKDLTPVASVDATRYSLLQDSVTLRLKRAFAAYTGEYTGAHPELRLP